MIHLDTHAVVWRYLGRAERFSEEVRHLLDSEVCAISPIVVLELQFLYEIERIATRPEKILRTLRAEMEFLVDAEPFERVIDRASREAWTRDPFDRIIVAQASLRRSILVTADRSISKHYAKTLI